MRPFDYPLNARARFSQNLLDRAAIPPAKIAIGAAPRVRSRRRGAGYHRGRERYPPAHPASGQRRRALFNRPLLCGPHPLADAATFRQRFAARFSARANGITLRRSQTRISARRAQPKSASVLKSRICRRCCACAPLTTVTVKAARRNTPSA